MTKKLRVVFLGTPDLCLPTLKYLAKNDFCELVEVITQPARAFGRGMKLREPAVAEFMQKEFPEISLFQTANINKEVDWIKKMEGENIDFFLVFAFAQFLSQKILNLPRLGAFNIHASLLPKYRGAAPVQFAILNGEKISGITLQKMVKKMDAGDIVVTKTLPLESGETTSSYFSKLKDLAVDLVKNFVEDSESLIKSAKVQVKEEASYAPLLEKKDGHLKLTELSWEKIDCMMRAFDLFPGVYVYFEDKVLKILGGTPTDKIKLRPGEVKIIEGKLFIGTKTKSFCPEKLQLAGKPARDNVEFTRGLLGRGKEKIVFL